MRPTTQDEETQNKQAQDSACSATARGVWAGVHVHNTLLVGIVLFTCIMFAIIVITYIINPKALGTGNPNIQIMIGTIMGAFSNILAIITGGQTKSGETAKIGQPPIDAIQSELASKEAFIATLNERIKSLQDELSALRSGQNNASK